jgi:hypothetical protein
MVNLLSLQLFRLNGIIGKRALHRHGGLPQRIAYRAMRHSRNTRGQYPFRKVRMGV